MKVLLATDGSEYSNIALDELANQQYPEDTEVCIISVYNTTPLLTGVPTEGIPEWQEVTEAAKEAASGIVERAAHLIKEKRPEWSVCTTVTEGIPKYAILQEAEKMEADLIMVGSHGRGAMGRFLLGSVSQTLALHAKCSVEIVRIPSWK